MLLTIHLVSVQISLENFGVELGWGWGGGVGVLNQHYGWGLVGN